ncbi:MAG: type IX secretion system membrane protein PorP/SprF [Bacteroidota bacterium]
MRKSKNILLLFVFCLISILNQAQDPQFTQIYATPLYTCSAFAGSTNGSRVVFNIRDQWPAIPGAFISTLFSYDHYFSNLNSGLGILFMRDRAGSGHMGITTVSIHYTYNIRASRVLNIRPAIQFGYGQRSIDFHRLLFNDQLDFDGNSDASVEVPSDAKNDYADFGIGLLAFGKNYWGGFSIDHLTEPDQSLTGSISILPRKHTLFGGYKHLIKGKIGEPNEESVSGNILYKSQGKYDQIDLGAYWYKRPLVVGFWYRGIPLFKAYHSGYQNNDAIAIMAGYQLEKVKIAYSYDFTVSRLALNTAGSHEISLIYEFMQSIKFKKKAFAVPCPKF